MDALDGGSISRACSKLGIICAMKTRALNLFKSSMDIIAPLIKLICMDFHQFEYSKSNTKTLVCILKYPKIFQIGSVVSFLF